MCNIWIAIFWLFWLIFGQKIASHTCRSDFLHKWIVHKKFQLKIPTLSKNDCSATWKPNTNQKNFTQDLLRNVQRYQKYVPIFWAFLTLPQVSYFWYVFGFQVALQSFLLKVGILSWNFLWTILLCKKSTLRVWKAIFCPKMRQNSQKIAIRILHVAC